MRNCDSGDSVNAQTTSAATPLHVCADHSIFSNCHTGLERSQRCTSAAADPYRCPTLSPRRCVSAAAARGGGKASGHLQGTSLKQLAGQTSHTSKARRCMTPALSCITPAATGAHEHLACLQRGPRTRRQWQGPLHTACYPQGSPQQCFLPAAEQSLAWQHSLQPRLSAFDHPACSNWMTLKTRRAWATCTKS